MNTLKKTLLVLIVLSNLIAFSQKKKDPVEYLSNFDKKTVRWGFYLGMNSSNYNLTYRDNNNEVLAFATDNISIQSALGFNVGLIGDLRLHKNFNLRLEPGVFYHSNDLIYEYLNGEDKLRTATSTYLYVPLLVQFSADRYKNIRPYVAGGLAYGYNFTSNYNLKDDNYNKKFRLQANNYFYEIGIGMDFYFYFFKFSPSIRGVFAINNELQRDEKDINTDTFSKWTTPIDFLGTRAVFLRLSFQ